MLKLKEMRSLDPRTKLLLLIPANILLFLHGNIFHECLAFCLYFFICLYQKQYRIVGRYSIYLVLSLFFEYLLQPYLNGFILNLGGFIFLSMRKMAPAILSGHIFFHDLKTNELICALKKMYVPQAVVIPIAVLMRFFPTIKRDWQNIKNAMAIRGITFSFKNLLIQPLQMFEYILVPFLMNALKTADDLAVASITRGIENPKEHTSLKVLHFKIADFITMLCTSAVSVMMVLL